MNYRLKILFSIFFVLIFPHINVDRINAQTNPSIFTNSSTITVNDDNAASPYPSNITVSGLTGTVTDINVRLNGLSHTYVSDIALLLVAPDTNRRFVLLSDCGERVAVSNITVTFDDQASGLVPCDASAIPTGSYQPTSRPFDNGSILDGLDLFPAPAPQPAESYSEPAPTGTATLNGTFGGTNPNGVWSLYVVDKGQGDTGQISGGYSLIITAQTPPPTNAVVLVSGRLITAKGNGISNVRVVMTDSNGIVRTALSDSLGYYSFSDVIAGQTYIFSVSNKHFTFYQSAQVHTINQDTDNINFIETTNKKWGKFDD